MENRIPYLKLHFEYYWVLTQNETKETGKSDREADVPAGQASIRFWCLNLQNRGDSGLVGHLRNSSWSGECSTMLKGQLIGNNTYLRGNGRYFLTRK